MKDLKCPYCEKELEVCHDDGFGYEENVRHQMECDHCGKFFVFETVISFSYNPAKADCLNDDNHIWKPNHTYPKELTRMECEICGETRRPTAEEWEKILKNKELC